MTKIRNFLIGLAVLFVMPCLSAAADVELTARVVATTDGAFSIKWESACEFTDCIIHVWTNRVVDAEAGSCVWHEGFSRAQAVTGNNNPAEITNDAIKDLTDADTPADEAGFRCHLVFPSKEDGVLRIGNSDEKGWLETPPFGFEGNDMTLKIRVKRYSDRDGKDMPVMHLSGNVTNQVAVFTVANTNDFAEYIATIAELQKEDSFVIHSTTNRKSEGRILLDSIEIWQGVKAAFELPVTNLVCSLGTSGAAVLSHQPPARLFAQLEGRREAGSVWSNVLSIDLQKSSRAFWRASSFKKNERREDFGWVTNVTKKTPWMNGETIAGFYACQCEKDGDESEVDEISFDSKIVQTSGLFASFTNKENFVWSVSLRAKGEVDTVLELRLLNDKDKIMNEVTLVYDEYEWPNSHKENEAALTNAYSIAQNPLILPIDWEAVAGGQISREGVVTKEDLAGYGYSKNRTTVTIPVKVAPGEMFFYRWIAPKMSNAPMLGVGDLTVTLGWQPGFAVILR